MPCLGDDLGLLDFSSSSDEKEKERDDKEREKEREREPLLWSGDVLRLTQVRILLCHVMSWHVMFTSRTELKMKRRVEW